MKSLWTIVKGLLICFCSMIVMGAKSGVSDCCHEKKVGDKIYTLITASNETSKFGCHDACIYQNKIKPGPKICFAKGNLQSKCQRKTNCKCGVKRKGTRIIDGKEAEVNEYPWIARLVGQYSINGFINQFTCGGSLIASRWVLTASHCLPFQDTKTGTIIALLGSHDADNEPVESSDVKDIRKAIVALEWFIHPYYDVSVPNDNDIGLVYLANPFDINIYTPVCLPHSQLDLKIAGKTAWLVGWGANSSYQYNPNDTESDWLFTDPESLMEKQMVIEDHSNCMDYYMRKDETVITMGMICANSTNFEGEKNAAQCRGDSGGPLTVEDKDGRHVIVGDVSFGPRPCEEINTSGAYGNVAFFREWIEHTMKTVQGEEPERCDHDYSFDFQ